MLSVGFSQAGDRGPDVQDDAKAKVAKSQVLLLSKAVDAFALMNKGEYPAKLEDLLATKPPILESKAALIDPWKKPYRYDASGPKNAGVRPDIWTVTPANDTIGNWPAKPKDTYESLEFEVKVKEAQALVAVATKAVEAYALLKGAFPDTLEEMLKDGKFNGPLLDPWKRPIQYDRKGPKNKGIRPDRKRPDVWTERPDTKELIGNWQALEGDPKKAIYDAQVKLTRFSLAALSTAVKAYHVKNNRFPDTLNELTKGKPSLVETKALLDPWGRFFLYDLTGPNNNGTIPDIWTEPPGRERIGNWQKEEKKK